MSVLPFSPPVGKWQEALAHNLYQGYDRTMPTHFDLKTEDEPPAGAGWEPLLKELSGQPPQRAPF